MQSPEVLRIVGVVKDCEAKSLSSGGKQRGE